MEVWLLWPQLWLRTVLDNSNLWPSVNPAIVKTVWFRRRIFCTLNQWKIPAILLFSKKINSASWKEPKNQVSVFIFHRTKSKIVNFFVYMLVNYVKSEKMVPFIYFFFQKSRYFSFRAKIFWRQYCLLLIHFSPNKQSFRSQKKVPYFLE